MNPEDIINFLKNKGFALVQKEIGISSFGDSRYVVQNPDIAVELESDKLIWCISLSRANVEYDWYDLDTVLCHLNNEPARGTPLGFENQSQSLKEHLSRFAAIFSDPDYPKTVVQFKKLIGDRARMMYPKLWEELNNYSSELAPKRRNSDLGQ